MLVRIYYADSILLEDPVRPSIKPEDRFGHMRDVWALIEDKRLTAILCVAYHRTIPTTEAELMTAPDKIEFINAILYSIWSYHKGAGSKLVREYLKMACKKGRVITMSPRTEMARNFHYKNGARLLQTNEETVNYEY